jgi:hypothetical protein
MFEHFAFGAQHPDRFRPDISPSPTDTSLTSTSAPTSCPSSDPEMAALHSSISEIMLSLRDQTLQPREDLNLQPPAPPPLLRDPEPPCASSRVSCAASLPNAIPAPTPPDDSAACRRLQRQLNVQLQTSQNHIRDVKALVEDMILTNSQCAIRPASRNSLPAPPQPDLTRDLIVDHPMDVDDCPPADEDTDEGFQDGPPPKEKLVYRRARAPLPAGIRKAPAGDGARGADYVVVEGRVLVRSAPRMRKRKPRPPRIAE